MKKELADKGITSETVPSSVTCYRQVAADNAAKHSYNYGGQSQQTGATDQRYGGQYKTSCRQS